VISRPATLTLGVIGILICFYFVWRAGKKLPVFRPFVAIDSLPEIVGRCVEMGRPVLLTPGAYGAELNRPGPVVASLPFMNYVARQCAKYGARMITCVAYADTYAAAVPAIESGYIAEGKSELYVPEDIIYYGSLEGYLIGTPAEIAAENVGALIQTGSPASAGVYINEMAVKVGAMASCLAANTGASIVFYSLCSDYLTIGEEYYAASAAIAGDRTQLGSIVGTDLLKIALLLIGLIGIILTAAAPDLAKDLITLLKS